ncbi:hypothetical protein I4U23_015909 [Adineta vaga]|nr:hypothetical protein I4U23_015909 [Adineta vaga]
MPNINSLLYKLNMSTIVSVNISHPRDIVTDSYDHIASIEEFTNDLVRFDPTNLTIIDRSSILIPPQMTMTFFNNAYYIASYSGFIIVIDSQNLTMISNFSSSVYGLRGIIFVNQGQMMILTSFENNCLVFLNRTSLFPIQYQYSFRQTTSFPGPHGIWRMNDSFFYVTSYTNNALYSYRTNDCGRSWNETFVLQMAYMNSGSANSRLTIDECNRFWFAFETDTILIYDQNGTMLGNWILPNSLVFDVKIMNNYLMYVSESNRNRIRRFQPAIQC